MYGVLKLIFPHFSTHFEYFTLSYIERNETIYERLNLGWTEIEALWVTGSIYAALVYGQHIKFHAPETGLGFYLIE
jgi:hypothetical protein